ISKYNAFKADEQIANLESELKQVEHDLKHLVEYAIAYYQRLLDKYGKGRERKTKITSFETIKARAVVANNAKLYVNRKDGFVGYGIKKEEFVSDCSDIDDIIIIRKDGVMKVVRISEKVFVGKNVLHVGVWKKGDDRTTYNLVYVDGKTGRSMGKRFNVTAITREKEYPLTKGTKGSKVHYLTVNYNGESEVVRVQLSQGCTAKKKVFDFDFGELAIKGRGAQGNIVTRYPVRKVTQLEVGKSTLGAQQVWMDEVSGRLNTEKRGLYLGDFDTGDSFFALYKSGAYEVLDYDLTKRFDPKELVHIGKFNPEAIINVVYFDGNKGWTMVKRFVVETSKNNQRFSFLTEHKSSKLFFASLHAQPEISYDVRVKSVKTAHQLDVAEFIDVKGWKSLGNKLEASRITNVQDISKKEKTGGKLKAGDTVDFDIDDKGQGKMF
ncbi:MAG: DNA gyrase/topoisomerase IV subunit A, partial [Bacteroidota bacterium]